MGYSNNKWRKILYILMIINLCFILFAKFSRVFGANTIYVNVSDYNTDNTVEVALPSVISDNNLNYVIGFSKTSYYYFIYASNDNIYITNDSLFSDGSSKYAMLGSFGNFSQMTSFIPGHIDKVTTYKLPLGNYITTPENYYYYSNTQIKDTSDNIIFDNTVFNAPYFDNVTEIENGYPDGVFISRGDYSANDDLYFHLLGVDSQNISSSDGTVFYYTDNIFLLNKDTEYYKTYPTDTDPNEDYSYYYIPRYELSLNMNYSYVYVLNNSSSIINNSHGHIQIDKSNGVYDVIESDTTGVITQADMESDRLNRIEQENVKNAQNTSNISNSLTNTTPDTSLSETINENLDFNNDNVFLNSLNFGFFSRLTSLINSVSVYDLSEDTTIDLPISMNHGVNPENITLHSNFIYSSIRSEFIILVQAFWYYIFTFYVWKFVNKLYVSIASGKILDNFSSSDEVITNHML